MTGPAGQTRAAKGSRTIVLEANSFDRESRTLRYVLTTDTPCPAMRFRSGEDGEYGVMWVQEILEPANCTNLGTIAGLPLVDSHADLIDRPSLAPHDLGTYGQTETDAKDASALAAARAYINAAIAALVDGAPGALDTLRKLAE